jgi:archaellin
MKFNAYIVEFKHKENSFTGTLIASDKPVSANFRKIGHDLFIANFKTQVEFKFLEKVAIKQKNKEALVLLPLLSKYNKRKLIKISKFLSSDAPGARDQTTILLNLLTVEKFLKAQELLSFFTMNREELIDFLIQKEVQQAIKIVDFTHLSITTYENMRNYIKELKALLTGYHSSGAKSIKLSEVETRLKLSQSSIFFKYLLQCCKHDIPLKISKDKIALRKLALSDDEKDSLVEIEAILKENKISIFTVENILKHSSILEKEITDSLWLLMEAGKVIQLNEDFYIFKDELNKIVNKLKKYKRNQGEMIDIQSLRELTLFTRKYIIALFEYFDTNRITQRVENQRRILIPA